MRKLRSRLTFANVASAIALFVALSTGGAYAANEWTGANVVDESLTGSDVKGKAQTSSVAAVNGTLTGYDVAGQPAIPSLGQPFIDGSLTTWDINDSTLAGRDVQDGSLTSPDVLDGTLAARDLANNAVGTSQVANGTLQAQDFAPGVLATFRAYGHISGTNHTRSKNVLSVQNPSEGVHCITLAGGIDPRQSAPVATGDINNDGTTFGENPDTENIVEIDSVPDACSPGQLEVETGVQYFTTAIFGGQQYVTHVENFRGNSPFFFVLP